MCLTWELSRVLLPARPSPFATSNSRVNRSLPVVRSLTSSQRFAIARRSFVRKRGQEDAYSRNYRDGRPGSLFSLIARKMSASGSSRASVRIDVTSAEGSRSLSSSVYVNSLRALATSCHRRRCVCPEGRSHHPRLMNSERLFSSSAGGQPWYRAGGWTLTSSISTSRLRRGVLPA